MSNETIRKRTRAFVNYYPISLVRIGKQIGFEDKSRYLISRFLRGADLKEDSLKMIDSYLIARGY